MARAPFIWGDAGQALTPQEVQRRRMAATLMRQQASDTSPVGHWSAALARALQGYAVGRDNRRADASEREGMERARGMWESLYGGSPGANAGIAEALMGSGQPAAVPGGDMAAQIRAGLINRGLPEHVADAFLLNMQDESGLRTDINEAAPIVPGSRGGYGLIQWTGPRRRQLEAFAAERGVAPSDLNAQLDFLMQELSGSEAQAGRAIMGAQDMGSAATAILNQFLRPAEAHRARREAAYLGGAQPRMGGGAPGAGQPAVAQIAAALGDPWFAQQYGGVAQALMGQQMQQQNAAYEQSLRQQDPMYQAQLAMAQHQLQAAQNPAPPAPVFEGGQWWDMSSGQPMPLTDRAVDPTSTMQNLQAAGLQPGSPEFAEAMLQAVTRPQTQINMPGQPNIGTIPQGWAATQDPQSGAWSMAPIEGGPAWQEQQAAQQQAAMRGEQTGRYADVVLDDIDMALGLAGTGTTGMLGSLLQNVPGTNARNLDALLQTIRSNIGFDRLQAMREASPTGGALGAVSDFENRQLQATLGNLEQSQTEAQLRRNLERVRELYLDIIHGPGNRPGEDGGGDTAAPSHISQMDMDGLLGLDVTSLTPAEMDAMERRLQELLGGGR